MLSPRECLSVDWASDTRLIPCRVGNLRFAAPQPPTSFTGVADATSFGAVCPQQDIALPALLPANVTITSPSGLVSEDCTCLDTHMLYGTQ